MPGLVAVVVADDRNFTGQLGDRNRVAVAAPSPTPTSDRRGAKRPIFGQQFGHRDRLAVIRLRL
jgi:hypothetical protein